MAKYERLRAGDPMKQRIMRRAMAMIELVFAIVIIAISVMTIPSMMSVAANASKGIAIDEDVMSRMSGWLVDKFQARWDEKYEASNSGILWITGAQLGCSLRDGSYYRDNNASTVICDDQNRTPSTISGSQYPDGNLSKGIERLNMGEETISITPVDGTAYNVTATYRVAYVDSTIAVAGSTATAQWTLGSSDTMNPSPSGTATHLKRVVTRFNSDDLDVDTTLTFFKSNKGN